MLGVAVVSTWGRGTAAALGLLAAASPALAGPPGQIVVRGDGGANTLVVRQASSGNLVLTLDGRRVARAAGASTRVIRFAGGRGFDRVEVGDVSRGGGLFITSDDEILVGGHIHTAGLRLRARTVRVSGTVTAPRVALTGTRLVELLSASRIVAAGGSVRIDGGLLVSAGLIDAHSDTAGRVTLSGRAIIQAGVVDATGERAGGRIAMRARKQYMAMRDARMDVSATNRAGVLIVRAARITSSAKHAAAGESGGSITLAGATVALAGARVSADGARHGGTVLVGGRNATRTATLSAATTLSATGGRRGGAIEVSAASTVAVAADIRLAHENGTTGRLLVDPKNVAIANSAGHPALELVDPAPGAGNGFGIPVVLTNGNIAVDDRLDDVGGADAGAVYLYDGLTGALISTLHGTTANDRVGSVTPLTNGNYVVASLNWDNPSGPAVDAGAATFRNGTADTSGVVSAANSLVGTTANDFVAEGGVTALTNGNYVVRSSAWDNASPVAAEAGAVTFGSGTGGVSGAVGASNSLVGTRPGDSMGIRGVTALESGNYVVASSFWDNPAGPVLNVGAVTFGNGATGVSGVVTASNSLLGTTPNDFVGDDRVTALAGGNYVVKSPKWNRTTPSALAEVGAVTFGLGTTGVMGPVTETNSLVGGALNDRVGSDGVFALTNGNYVVQSGLWNNPSTLAADAGAVTFGDGVDGVSGPVTDTNSLVGTSPFDDVGGSDLVPLPNGNYVVRSTQWNNTSPAAAEAGAVTFGNGATGTAGAVTDTNSLVGSTAFDNVGRDGVVALANGAYVVKSADWDNPSGPAVDAGAVTYGSAVGGVSGVASAVNSLVGTSANDSVGDGVVAPLANGNYVVGIPSWDNPAGPAADVGAATFGSGTGGISGPATPANSLVGTSANDLVGQTVAALTNGNYVVGSASWDNPVGPATDAGAATFANGSTGIAGPVTPSNSLVGTAAGAQVASFGIAALKNGNYIVRSPAWDNPSPVAIDAGAVTWGNGVAGTTGGVNSANSLVGTSAGDNVGDQVVALANGNYVVVSAGWDNTVPVAIDAGAATIGDGTVGVTGVVSGLNGIVGGVAVATLQGAFAEPVHGSVLLPFTGDGPGRLYLALAGTDAGDQFSYSRWAAASPAITPAYLAGTLNRGSAATIQASNDLTVTDAVAAANPFGAGGPLTLAAGRSLLLNAGLTTDDGPLSLIANDNLSNGVVDLQRDAGAAAISSAAGTAIDTGTGALSVDLRAGSGKTNAQAGGVTLGAVTSGALSIASVGNVTLAGATTPGGATNVSAPGSTVSIAGAFSPGGAGVRPTTVTGDLALSGSLAIDAPQAAPGGFDAVQVTGAVSVGGAFSVTAPSFPQGASLVVIANDGADAVSGTFAGLPEGAAVPGTNLRVRYAGGDGNDVALVNPLPAKKSRCTVTGTAKADRLRGTKKADVICGLGGNDTIRGLGGNDVLEGGPGNDRIEGGSGRDRLVGGAGKDRLLGGAGIDTLLGGAGSDILSGGPARDILNGGPGRDRGIATKGDRVRGVEVRVK